MSAINLPSSEEINAAYEDGREAVILLFRTTMMVLAERIQSLEDQLAKTAGTAASRHPAMDTIKDPVRRVCENARGAKAEVRRAIQARR